MPNEEIIFLAHRIPFPPNKGDKIRSWRIVKYLSTKYDINLCAFVDDPDDFQHENFLQNYCKSVNLIALNPQLAKIRSVLSFVRNEPLSLGYYYDRKMRATIRRLQKRDIKFQFVFSSTMVPYAMQSSSAPIVVDLCDADSEKWTQYAQDASFPMNLVYAREGRQLARFESTVINKCEASFAISHAEACILDRNDVSKSIHWFANGVDTAYFDPTAQVDLLAQPPDIAFVGAMDYHANIDAALWFAENVWPLIRAQLPECQFAIVGSNPVDAVMRLDGVNGISVTGRVEDVRPYLAGAKIAIAPMRIARGIQNKVLEAMAMGAALVATSAACEGLSVKPGRDYLSADIPTDFCTAITGLLDQPSKRVDIGRNARQTVTKRYSWDGQLNRLGDVLEATFGTAQN